MGSTLAKVGPNLAKLRPILSIVVAWVFLSSLTGPRGHAIEDLSPDDEGGRYRRAPNPATNSTELRPIVAKSGRVSRAAPSDTRNTSDEFGMFASLTKVGRDPSNVGPARPEFDRCGPALLVHARVARSCARSEEHSAFQKHLRSMGWTNFFFGGRDALLATSYFVAKASRSPDLWNNCSVEDPAHRHIRAAGVDVRTIYRIMPSTLLTVWNETGDWVIAGRTSQCVFVWGQLRGDQTPHIFRTPELLEGRVW